MKLTSREFHNLRQAVKIADAQRELVELTRRRPADKQSWQSEAGMIAAALTLIFVIALASLTEAPDSDTLADNWVPQQRIVSVD